MKKKEYRGQSIKGSRYKRSFCKGCGCPMRVIDVRIDYWCVECSPHSQGVSSPKSPHDNDAYGVSTQHDYGNIKGF